MAKGPFKHIDDEDDTPKKPLGSKSKKPTPNDSDEDEGNLEFADPSDKKEPPRRPRFKSTDSPLEILARFGLTEEVLNQNKKNKLPDERECAILVGDWVQRQEETRKPTKKDKEIWLIFQKAIGKYPPKREKKGEKKEGGGK